MFGLWTNPEHLKKWWRLGNEWTTETVEVDLRAGGEFRFGVKKIRTGETHVVSGIYHEVVPPRRLAFSFKLEGETPSEMEELVTIELHDVHGDTQMDLVHSRMKKGESMLSRTQAWEIVLANLGNLASTIGSDESG